MYESVRRATDKYHKEKLVRKIIIFRRDHEEDMRALERIMAQESHSAYVRRLVLEDIEREQAQAQSKDN